MNGLDENGKGVLSDDEKRAKTLSKFGLNPLRNYEDPGEAPVAGEYAPHYPEWNEKDFIIGNSIVDTYLKK